MKKLIITIMVFATFVITCPVNAGTMYVNFDCTTPTFQEAKDLFTHGNDCLMAGNFKTACNSEITLKKYPLAKKRISFVCGNHLYTELQTRDGRLIVCRNLDVPDGCLVMNAKTKKISWFCAKDAPRGGVFEITK